MRARTRVVRADDVEALRLPLVGAVMGPGGPITWLPTLNRVHEGLQSQGLTRVVTDTPVTTRAVARATGESGDERSWRLPTALASRFAERRGVVHAGCDGPTRGSVAPPVASLRDVGRADVRRRRGNSLAPDLCAIGLLQGRPIALRQAARRQAITRPELVVLLKPRFLLGASPSMRVSSATPGYLNPGTHEGPRTDHPQGGVIACTQEEGSLPRRKACSSAERWPFEGAFRG